MNVRFFNLNDALLGFMLFLAASTNIIAADSPAALTARESGTPLYAPQDRETEPIMRLQKGAALAKPGLVSCSASLGADSA